MNKNYIQSFTDFPGWVFDPPFSSGVACILNSPLEIQSSRIASLSLPGSVKMPIIMLGLWDAAKGGSIKDPTHALPSGL